MNALAGTTVPAVGCHGSTCASGGSQPAQYDNGVVFTTYDAGGNALSTTDEQGDTTTSTYNALNEVLSSTDAMGNTTTNTYNSTGQLLTTTSPPTNSGGSEPETSNWYGGNGTLCASRDADQVTTFGLLSSCATTGSNATIYTYDSSGDQALSTVTDSSAQTSSTQDEFDADGSVCATLSPDGYAITADRLSGCPSLDAPYTTVTVTHDVYGNPTKSTSSLSVTGTNTYATTFACTDSNGNTTASVGPMGSVPTCPDTSHTTSIDTTFTLYDPSGDKVQSISPFADSGSQGPTATSQFDANGSDVLDLSSRGYVVWENNNAATLTPYEAKTLTDDQGNTAAIAPETDTNSSCVDNVSDPCPDDSITTYDNMGQELSQVTAGNGESESTTPITSTTVNNSDSTAAGGTSEVGGGSTGVEETSQSTYNANQAATNQINEHWNGSTWATDSAITTAHAPDGSPCWTAPTNTAAPTCASPPAGQATVDYYDADGHIIAEVGSGGSGSIGTSGHCNPIDAFTYASAYSIDTSDLCAFTTYSVFDEASQLTETIEPSTSSATTGYVSGGVTTSYSYDPSGNQATEVNPAGNTVSSTYDGSNRLVGITYSDVSISNCSAGGATQETCYTYNADGTRSQMVDSTGTTSFSYDNAGQLVSETDSNSNTVTYGYSQFGQENCISYPGYSGTDSCLSVDNSNNGTNTIDPGEVWYSYDPLGRTSTILDWNGDAFTYGYDCTGDVAWLVETPSSQVPTVTECTDSSGVPTSPTPPLGSTYLLTTYDYSSGGSGNLLLSKTTDSVTSSVQTSLLEFNSLTYDDDNHLMSSTPKVSGASQATDTYATGATPYDAWQRVPLSPEPSGWSSSYGYVGVAGSPFESQNTADQMGIDVMPASSSTYTGLEYTGNGETCWEAPEPSASSTNPCGPPSSPSDYEAFSYNSSGDLTATTAEGFGSSSTFTWDVDESAPTCMNPAGSSCSGPSSSQPEAAEYKYNADVLRTSAETWNASTSSVATTDFTWDTESSALLSDGTFDYIYGLNGNVPIAQLDVADSVTSELLTDANENVRGIVELSSSAADPDVLANYTDYEDYGVPISGSGGTLSAGGLNQQVGTDPDSKTNFGFGGGYADSSGLDYLVHRYYDPAIGQFISIDPELTQTGQPYAYSIDDPVNGIDSLGDAGSKKEQAVGAVVAFVLSISMITQIAAQGVVVTEGKFDDRHTITIEQEGNENLYIDRLDKSRRYFDTMAAIQEALTKQIALIPPIVKTWAATPVSDLGKHGLWDTSGVPLPSFHGVSVRVYVFTPAEWDSRPEQVVEPPGATWDWSSAGIAKFVQGPLELALAGGICYGFVEAVPSVIIPLLEALSLLVVGPVVAPE